MTTEVELKFIIAKQAIARLSSFLSQWHCDYLGKHVLTNTYYETDDNYLRSQKLGLRVRSQDDHHEMTLKGGGNALAGLHQRTEYNVALSQPVLDLSLLPSEAWPQGCDIKQLASQLSPLFTTNFSRENWLVSYRDSEIELALDQGDIAAFEQKEEICEIEMELKKGNVDDMLAFAYEFAALGDLLLFSQSKAARGYALVKKNQGQVEQKQSYPLPVLAVTAKLSLEQGLELALKQILTYWEFHDIRWLDGDKQARKSIELAFVALRQVWVLWGAVIPRKATARLRELLTELEQQVAQHDATSACSQPEYVRFKLALIQWLMSKQWQTYLDDDAKTKMSGSFKRFADITLSRINKSLRDVFSRTLTETAFNDQLIFLRQQVIALHLLAGVYAEEQYSSYLQAWKTLLDAIANANSADKNKLAANALSFPIFWKGNLVTNKHAG